MRQASSHNPPSHPTNQATIFPKLSLDIKVSEMSNQGALKSKNKGITRQPWVEVKAMLAADGGSRGSCGGGKEMEAVLEFVQAQIKNNKYVVDLISNLMLDALENSDTDRTRVGQLVGELKKHDLLSNEQFMKAFKVILGRLQSLDHELPLAKSHLSNLASNAISSQAMHLIDFAGLLTNGAYYPLFLLCLQQLVKNEGEEWLMGRFNDSKISLKIMLPQDMETDDKLMEVLEGRGLSFLMPLQKVQADLWKFLTTTATAAGVAEATNDLTTTDSTTLDDTTTTANTAAATDAMVSGAVLYKWLKKSVDQKLHSEPSFVSLFVTTLVKFITAQSTLLDGCDVSVAPEKVCVLKEKLLLEKYKGVLQKFLLDKTDLHVTAIYALQVLSHQWNNPKGLLLRLFSNLYDMEVVYEDAFIRWKEEVNDLQPGKGQALFQVNQWLVWLEQADDDSDEED